MKKINIKWSQVDWKKQDIVLATELGLTRERVRQKRLEIISILRNRRELKDLLDNRVENLKVMEAKRTECVRERMELTQVIARARLAVGRGEAGAEKYLVDLLEERRALRLRVKRLRQKLAFLANPEELKWLLSLSKDDLESQYWHRPSDTREVFDFLAGLKVEEMTRAEIVQALKDKGIERSFSWVSNALNSIGRVCRRKTAVRKPKYNWGTVVQVDGEVVAVEGGLLTLNRYQEWTDQACAKVLGISNPSVVTQWRKVHGIRKHRVLAVAEKDVVGEKVTTE